MIFNELYEKIVSYIEWKLENMRIEEFASIAFVAHLQKEIQMELLMEHGIYSLAISRYDRNEII